MGRVLGFTFVIFFSTQLFAQSSCENFFKTNSIKTYSAQELEDLSPQERMLLALSVKDRFNAYFGVVNKYLKEREFVVEIIQIALLAREHVLLMGPPGNAKSLISDVILGNISNEETGNGSYYKIQMTPETTMSETHGPLDYVKLSSTSKYERIYEEGMLMSRNVFVDEIFDSRANALRNLLMLMNERAHAQGPRIIKGKIETIIAATNRYISEVYETAGTDGPKAVIDRFAFSIFVPGDLELTQSAVELVQTAKKQKMVLPKLSFQDLDKLRSLVSEVEIPDSVAKFLVHLRSRIKEDTEAREESGLKAYKEKIKNGELPPPPYRATKYQSPRTLNKAGGILKAIVVQEWLKSGGTRPLRATLEDVKKLEIFFTLNGPRADFIEQEIGRAVNEHEKVQLMSIKQERETFNTYFEQINTEVNTVVYGYSLLQLQQEVDALRTPVQKEEFSKKLIEIYIEVFNRKQHSENLTSLTGEQIGLETVELFVTQTLRELLGKDYERVVGNQLEQMVLERERTVREETQKERARLEEERKTEARILAKEAEAKRKQEEAAKRDQELGELFSKQDRAGAPDYDIETLTDRMPGSDKLIFMSHQRDIISTLDSKGNYALILNKGHSAETDLLFRSKPTFFKMIGPETLLIAIDKTFYTLSINTRTVTADYTLPEGSLVENSFYDSKNMVLYTIDKTQNRIIVTNAHTGARMRSTTLGDKSIIPEFNKDVDRLAVWEDNMVITSKSRIITYVYNMTRMQSTGYQIDKGTQAGEIYIKDGKLYALRDKLEVEAGSNILVMMVHDLKTNDVKEYRVRVGANDYEASSGPQNFAVIQDKYLLLGGKTGVAVASLESGNIIARKLYSIVDEVTSLEVFDNVLVINYEERRAKKAIISHLENEILNGK